MHVAARLIIAAFLLLINTSILMAETLEVIPGWNTLTSGSHQALAIPGKNINYNSVAVADLDNNTANGLEVVASSPDGQVTAVSANGIVLWTHQLPNYTCNSTSTSNKTFSSPAVGDLFGDGRIYAVVGYGGVGGSSCGGGVVAIDGLTGQRRWHFDIRKFVKRKRIWANMYSVFGNPLLADVNNDGTMEVAFASFDRGVYLLNARGKPIFRYSAADTSWSSPAVADIDEDGKLELVVATDISRNDQIVPPTPDGGMLYVLKTSDVRRLRQATNARSSSSRRFKHYSFRSSDLVIWRCEFDQVLMSSPVVAELITSNPGPEIVVGSGCFFPQSSNNKRGKWFKVISMRTGEVLKTLPVTACSPSSAAVGDIDEDGALEIVVSVNGAESVGGDGYGRLMAFDPNSTTPLWSIIPRDRNGNMSLAGNFSSPIIADIDGNGSLEVLFSNSQTVGVYAGMTGAALTCQTRNCDTQISFRTGTVLFSTPTVADINNDGLPELISSAGIGSNAALFGWTDLFDSIVSAPGIHSAYSAPWPTHRGSVLRKGRLNSES